MTNSNSKGSRGERELRNFLNQHGWAVMRAPASGSGTDFDLPDLLAGKGHGNAIATEVKWVSEGIIYVDLEKAQALVRFAHTFGTVPLVSGRWDGDRTWYHAHIHDIPRTESSGNVSFKPRYRGEEWTYTTGELYDFVNEGHVAGHCPGCKKLFTRATRAPPDETHPLGYLDLCRQCARERADRWGLKS